MKKRIGLAVAAFLLLIIGFLCFEHFRGKWGLARWKGRMIARGELLTLAGVLPPLPPMNQNGMSPLIIAAGSTVVFSFKLWPPLGTYAATGRVVVVTRLNQWPAGGWPATNATWELLGEALKQREPALNAAIEALRHPKFNAALDFNLGWGVRLPHLSKLQYLERTLNAAALHRFRHGALDEGIRFLAAAIRIPGALEDEPLVISQLIRLLIANAAFETTWQALQVDGLTDLHLQELQQAWTEQDFLRSMRRALAMEHVMNSREFDRVRESDIGVHQWMNGVQAPPPPMAINSPIRVLVAMIERTPEFLNDGIYTPIWKFAWSYQDQLRFVQTVERGLKIWDTAVAEQSAGPLQPLGDAEYYGVMDSNGPWPRQNAYNAFRYALSPRAEWFFPAMKRAFTVQTLRQLALAAVALKRYELRHGQPAPTLEVLVPEFLDELPRDFMDGKPLRYTVATNGPLLYSVGGNGKDEGGDATTDVLKTFNILKGKDYVWPRQASSEETKWRFRIEE